MDETIVLRVTGTACHSGSCFYDLCDSGQMLNVQTAVSQDCIKWTYEHEIPLKMAGSSDSW